METTEKTKQGYFKVADDVWGLKDIFVNVYLVANPDKSWVLVDAGLKTSFPKIKQAAAALFGADVPPAAIVLTHGHFDHVGSLEAIIQEWNVPVYAHFLEMPYLTGKSDYPPADPSVGGGLMSWMSGLYPNDAIDLIDAVKSLPFDEHIPALPEWRYYHTPGHSPGHISLWREKDRLLLAGDAFVTTKQESAWCVLTQRKVLSGPPKYFTCNWYDSEKSVNTLAELQPETVATGHGKPMSGQEMKQQLMELAYNFPEKAVPAYGRYVAEPAVANQHGVVSLPRDRTRPERTLKLIGGLALALAGCIYFSKAKSKRKALWA